LGNPVNNVLLFLVCQDLGLPEKSDSPVSAAPSLNPNTYLNVETSLIMESAMGKRIPSASVVVSGIF
jgi:hypothetical protein